MTDHKEALLKAAANAKIRLTTEEVRILVPQLEEILTAFNKMDEIDVTNVEPTVNVIRQSRELRDDIWEQKHFDSFSNAKFVKNKKFIGPKLVD
ncbi:MAG: Asp-tRNA(Asn)/Glu-tRNA(Gln) amidotransferase subunit GatC [Candidatus Micrarchaeota archaeon]